MTLDLPNEQRLVRRIYLAENRVYLVSAQHGRGAMPDADKFFESFKITYNPPKSATPKPPTESATPPPTQVVVAPPPKGTPKMTPVPTAKAPPDAPPVPADFAITDDERAIVNEINKLRAGDKVAALKPGKKLFEAARAEVVGVATKKPVPPTVFGSQNIYRLSVPSRGPVSPAQLVQSLAATKFSRRELVDTDFQEIGVGIAKGEGDTTYYLIIFAGQDKN